jgi:hypothetical protein
VRCPSPESAGMCPVCPVEALGVCIAVSERCATPAESARCGAAPASPFDRWAQPAIPAATASNQSAFIRDSAPVGGTDFQLARLVLTESTCCREEGGPSWNCWPKVSKEGLGGWGVDHKSPALGLRAHFPQ